MESLSHAHLIVTCGLLGVIWMVQVSHYPLFLYLDRENFKEAMLVHQGKISWIVIPLMTVELALTLFTLHVPSIFIVGCIWLTTFFVQVPLHDELLRFGFDERKIGKLVTTNWIRTALWTLKAGILAFP